MDDKFETINFHLFFVWEQCWAFEFVTYRSAEIIQDNGSPKKLSDTVQFELANMLNGDGRLEMAKCQFDAPPLEIELGDVKPFEAFFVQEGSEQNF